MKTLLGSKFLALEPAGGGQLKKDSEIPLERTVSSYDIVNAFADLATTSEQINTDSAGEVPDHPRDRVQGQPAGRQGSPRRPEPAVQHDRVEGRRAAATCSPRPTASRARSRNATRRWSRSSRTPTCCSSSCNARRDAIHTLFTNTSAMAQQITGLVRDNRGRAQSGPRPADKVLAVLQKHEKDLGDTIAAMGPFTRLFANVLGNGRWFDTYIANLTTPVAAGGK